MPIDEEVPDIPVKETPEQAANNITAAKQNNMPADSYLDFKDTIAEEPGTPIKTSRAVANVMNESTQHQAVIKPDVEKLNWAERQWEFAKLSFEGSDVSSDLFDLQRRKVEGEELTPAEKFKIVKLNDQLKALNGDQEEYKYDFTESLPTQIAVGVYDFAKMAGDSADLIAQGMFAGGAGGALIGLGTANPIGMAGAMILGAQGGISAGLGIGLMRSAYRQTVGSIYNDLSYVLPETKDLPETTKRQISVGAGLASGAVSFLPVGALVKNTPFLKRIASPRAFIKHLATAEGSALKQTIISMGKQMMAEGAEEGIQEIIQATATQIGKDWDGTEQGFINGMGNAISDPKTWEQAGKAAVVGGAVGGVVQAGFSAADVAVRAGEKDPIIPAPPATDLQINPEMPPEKRTTHAKGVRAIQLKIALDQAVDITKDTQTKQLLPEELDRIRKQIYDSAGTGGIWVSKEELSAWATDDEKAAKARELIGPEGVAASQLNAPLRVEAHKFLKIAEDHPEITKLVSPDPTAPSFMSFMMDMEDIGRKRQDIVAEADKVQTDETTLTENQIKDLQDQKSQLPEDFDTAEIDSLIQEKQDQLAQQIEAVERPREIVTIKDRLQKEHAAIEKKQLALSSEKNKLLKRRDEIKEELVNLQIDPKFQSGETDELSGARRESQIEKLQEERTILKDKLSNFEEDGGRQRQAEIEGQLTAIEDESLREKRIRDEDISGEDQFLEQQTFTKDMEEVLPAKEILRLNEAETIARVEVADAIQADAEKETERITTLQQRFKEVFEKQANDDKYVAAPKIAMVEDFLDNSRILDEEALTPEQKEMVKKGIPVHAIDPDKLSDELKAKYADDTLLKFRKVFAKGGMEPTFAASIYNQESIEDFLDIMSKTPTTEEQIANGLGDLDADLKLQAGSNRAEIEEGRMAKAYDNMAKVHLKSAKILRDKYWPTFRKGVERVALDIPKLLTKLKVDAKETIGATKLKDLNINQWAVAQRKSQSKAVKAYLGGKLEEGFREKHNAAMATQLQKETRVATSKSNRALNFITKLSTEPYQRQLKDAGKSYTEAAKYILDVFNFHPSQKGQGDSKSYIKYINQMIAKGEGDQSIPPDVLKWLTPKEDATELTVDQLLYLEDKLRGIFKKAQLKNKLLRRDEIRTVEEIAEVAIETAKTHSSYDPDRIGEDQGKLPLGIQMFEKGMDVLETKVTNNQFMVLELDDGVTSGFFAKLLHDPIQGVGDYEGPTGLVADAKLRAEYGKRFLKMVDKHFKSWTEFKNYSVDTLVVPEFKNLEAFKKAKGEVSKHEMLMILANMGNEENRNYINNYGIDPDQMMEILERELTQRDFDFVQDAMWNSLKTLAPRIDAVSKSFNGVELDFVKQESFQAFGKTYDGGYFPIMLTAEGREISTLVETSIDALGRNPLDPKTNSVYTPAYEGVVRSPHTKERQGSNHLLDLNMERYSTVFDDMIYDITMREPIRDVMTLTTNPNIKDAMVSIIGETKYKSFVSNLAESTRSASATRTQVHSAAGRWMMNLQSNVESYFTAAYVALNPKSVIMSTLAFPQIGLRMGPKNFTKYMTKVSTRMMGQASKFDIGYFKQLYELASEIDPSFQNARAGIEDYSRSSIDKVTLKKRRAFGPKSVKRGYNNFRRLQEMGMSVSLGGILGGLDTMIKVMTTGAVYEMYLNGDAKGHTYDKVWTGKEHDEINRNAKAYTAQFLNGTTMRSAQYDKAELQKIAHGRMFTKFWNESRSQLNNYLRVGRDVRKDSKKMAEAFEAGDATGARMAFNDAGSTAMTAIAMMMVSKSLLNLAQYGTPFLTEGEDEDPFEDDGDFKGFLKYNLLDRPDQLFFDTVASSVPGLRDITFAVGQESRTAVPRYNVNVPFLAAATDIATAAKVPGEIALMVQDGMTVWEAFNELDDKEMRGFLAGTSYLVGGIVGINQVTKLRALVEEGDVTIPDLNFLNKDFLKNIDGFLEKYDSPEARFERMKQGLEGGGGTFKEGLIEEAARIRDTLNPVPKGDVLTQVGYDIIKGAESNGRWNARPGTSGAFGIYQFTEGTWKRVISTPEGKAQGLTMAGRFQKSSRQQEAGMRILTKYNVAQMRRKKVPINIESMYFAHHFGTAFADDVYTKPDNTKLPKRLISPDVLKANPQLKKQGVKTAGDMKKYIRRALKRGERTLRSS